MSFNKDDGIKQLEEVKRALENYPEMKYLIFILKCMLRQRDLHETYSGGIGSFLLFCLILAFLREFRRDYIRDDKLKDLENIGLGEYLIRFFEFYAIKNDWNRKKIIMINVKINRENICIYNMSKEDKVFFSSKIILKGKVLLSHTI